MAEHHQKYEDPDLKHEIDEEAEELAEKGCGVCNGCGGVSDNIEICEDAVVYIDLARNSLLASSNSGSVLWLCRPQSCHHHSRIRCHWCWTRRWSLLWEPIDATDKKIAIQWVSRRNELDVSLFHEAQYSHMILSYSIQK